MKTFQEWWDENGLKSHDVIMRCVAKHLWDDAQKEWESVQPLIDCRVCDHYVAGYLPCKSTGQCRGGDMWTRTKVVQVWPNVQIEGQAASGLSRSNAGLGILTIER